MNHILSLLESMKNYNQHWEAKEEPPSRPGPNKTAQQSLAELNLNALEENLNIFYLAIASKAANISIPETKEKNVKTDKYSLLLLSFADHLRQHPIPDPTMNKLMDALHSFVTNLS